MRQLMKLLRHFFNFSLALWVHYSLLMGPAGLIWGILGHINSMGSQTILIHFHLIMSDQRRQLQLRRPVLWLMMRRHYVNQRVHQAIAQTLVTKIQFVEANYVKMTHSQFQNPIIDSTHHKEANREVVVAAKRREPKGTCQR
jgi:hypothetical protein